MSKFKNLKIVLVAILLTLQIINGKIFYCSDGKIDYTTVSVKGSKNITTTENELSFYVNFKTKCGNPFVFSVKTKENPQDPQDLQVFYKFIKKELPGFSGPPGAPGPPKLNKKRGGKQDSQNNTNPTFQ